jgi:lysophospholipase L1-like esterase
VNSDATGAVLGINATPRPVASAWVLDPAAAASRVSAVDRILEPARISVPRTRPVIAPTVATAIATPRFAPGSGMAVLGDSYSSGWQGSGTGRRGWPSLVAAEFGWHVTNLAVPGTGYLNPGWTGQPIGALVDAAIRQRPEVVIIAAGHNDSRWTAGATGAAADRAIDRLRRGLPDAGIVIVAPIWSDSDPPSRCLALRDHLRATAERIGATFIDPLGAGWFTGRAHRFIGRDGIHPTDAGHVYLADQVLAALSEP